MAGAGHRPTQAPAQSTRMPGSGSQRPVEELGGETVFVRNEKIYAADNIGQLHGLRQVILSFIVRVAVMLDSGFKGEFC